MNQKIRQIFKNGRVIILIIFVALSLIAIYPNPYNEGVAIRSVLSNSTSSQAGIVSPKASLSPMNREVIKFVDNLPVKNSQDYYDIINNLTPNTTVVIQSNRNNYIVSVPEDKDIGLSIYDAPTSNIKKGLDLDGGTRVLLQPEEILSAENVETLISSMKERLNVYGLSDLVVREAKDLPPPLGTGNQYIVVEIAGASKEEVKDLLAKQGKFEAKIGNETAFYGGSNMITTVCRSAQCSGIDPQYGCSQASQGWVCRFRFSITLSKAAAENQAKLTENLGIIKEQDKQQYLDQKLELFLDDSKVDELSIAAELKGKAVTDIQISGSGTGITREESVINTIQNMKRLQTILLTGSLPVKLNIAKMETVSPQLGEEFIRNALFIALLSIFSVAIIIFLRYKKLKISLPIIATMISEIIIILGVAALIGWNLDLAAIAGIIITIGTGVNHQIVITDELLRGEKTESIYDWKERMKRAFFIIMGTFFTLLMAMLPLIFAGAGLLKGFAITSIIGVTIGVFVTRRAYASMIEILLKD